MIGALDDNSGATEAGAVYLFSTNRVLLTTITNPTPALEDHFGYAVAAVGNDRIFVGAWGDNTGSNNAGAAYLFTTNGAPCSPRSPIPRRERTRASGFP